MSDLVKRHRAAADALRHRPGNAAAAQCKFHSDTADEIERLNRLIDSRDKRTQQLLRWRKENKLREVGDE